jgi:hypothetical protein
MTNDERISALRDEAGKAGDTAMVCICDRALGELRNLGQLGSPTWRSQESAMAMTVAQARAECLRVLADAEAQH